MAYYVPSDKDEYKKSWSYTPGNAVQNNSNGTYNTSNGATFKNNYTTSTVTPGMSYAIKQAGGNPNAARAADKYVEDLMGRIGTTSANTGQTLTAADIQNELNRLGYSANTNGDWMTVGGQQFLVGGNDYNNLKNTLNNIGRGNMNIYTGQYMNGAAGGSLNGNYDGNLGYSSYIDAYTNALQAQLDRITEQQKLAQDNADREKRQAYVAMKLGQRALNEQNAASGLQDSGYSEQSNIALTADYGNNLNTISNNYQQYLNDLAGTYADTALSGAGTLADMYQQDYTNRFNAQKYADQMKQQDLENQWYEREYADQQKADAEQLAYQRSKTRADAAIDLGIWAPEIEEIYGITQAQFQAYQQAQQYSAYSARSGGQSSSSGGSGDSYVYGDGGDGYTPSPVATPGKTAATQDSKTAARTAGARQSYANQIQNIQKKYGLSAGDATDIYNRARAAGATTEDALASYIASNYGLSRADAEGFAKTVEKTGVTVDNLNAARQNSWQTTIEPSSGNKYYSTTKTSLTSMDDATAAKVAALSTQMGLDSQTALDIINTAKKSGSSLGDAYYSYIMANGSAAQKQNAAALAKSVDKYIK